MTLPWRKRLEYRLLRWQARLEGTVFNRGAPWLFALSLGVLLLLVALARSRELSEETALAGAMQTVWLIGEGFMPDASLLSHNYLFEQSGFLIYPVALLAKIFPTAITLLVIQCAALALGIVPLWRLARNVVNLRVGSTIAIVVAYGAYSAIHTVNLAGFHLEALALPALLAAVYNGLQERWIRYAILVVIVLAARADLGLAIAGLGAFWRLEGQRKAGYATATVGLGWFIVAVLLIQPAYAGGDFPHVEAFSAYGGDNPFSILWGVITSPVRFVQEVFSQANFQTVVTLLAPVLFLPVAAPRYLLPAVPLFCLYLVADVPSGTLEEAGQLIPITAFVFVALVFGIAKTGRVIVQRVNLDRRLIGALVLTAAVFFARDAITSPYEEPWAWGRQDAVDEGRLQAADLIPDEAVVRAGPKVLPLITERAGLFPLVLPDSPGADATTLADESAEQVDWIVLDLSEVPSWSAGNEIADRQFCQQLVAKGWVPVARQGGVEVYTFEGIAAIAGLEVAARSDEGVC
jgi:uncharacterized membrane protein